MNRNCSACYIKIDINNFKKNRTVCKTCYNKNKRKNKINTYPPNTITTPYQNENVKNIKNRTLIIVFSNCGETHLMNYILLRKQEPIFVITESLNQYPNINAQTSDEIQPLENYENSVVVSDDMLLSKQESNNDLFLTRGRHNNIDIFYISQSYFHIPKNTIRSNSKTIDLFKQTLRDIILLFHDIAGLDMILE